VFSVEEVKRKAFDNRREKNLKNPDNLRRSPPAPDNRRAGRCVLKRVLRG
jgi:hypothetical protein